MAKSNLLNTRTTNFLELIGNGRVYRVPPYQRDYSWEEDQWEDLWNDLLELRDRRDDRHYMGSLVVEGRSDREFEIIDGQQRLATLSIFGLAVIARLRSLADRGIDVADNGERASALRNRFIGEKDPASLVESSKLFLNETDDGFYQDYLVQIRTPGNPRGLPRSNRLLWECFGYFSRKLASLADADDGGAVAEILAETVARQLLFILITVDDDLSAYTVFETLNARGLELSTTDLLKNYLFSRLSTPADRRALQSRWKRLIGTVRQERFPDFLRYHLLCEEPRIRSQRLFKIVQERVRTPPEVFLLMDALESRGELFVALGDQDHSYWIERSGCRPIIAELSLFRVRAMTPLLFAAWERFEHEDFQRVLKLVSAISFRYSVVGRLNTNELEPVYHEAAKATLERRAAGPRQVFETLRAIYVPDEKFERDFASLTVETHGASKKLARYVLARLEQDASAKPCDPWTASFTIEHVLPENPAADWEESIPEDRWPAVMYRLGNLTPVEPAVNRELGNARFAAKVSLYQRSAYELTRSLGSAPPPDWTTATIDARQREMAARAKLLWRSDFA